MQGLLTGLMLCAVHINAPVIEDRHTIYDCRCHGRVGLAERRKEKHSSIATLRRLESFAWEED